MARLSDYVMGTLTSCGTLIDYCNKLDDSDGWPENKEDVKKGKDVGKYDCVTLRSFAVGVEKSG